VMDEHRSVSVYIDDFSRFVVYFEGDDASRVELHQTVWTAQRGASSALMSERVKRAIETAKKQLDAREA
jgi:hypothetical protein